MGDLTFWTIRIKLLNLACIKTLCSSRALVESVSSLCDRQSLIALKRSLPIILVLRSWCNVSLDRFTGWPFRHFCSSKRDKEGTPRGHQFLFEPFGLLDANYGVHDSSKLLFGDINYCDLPPPPLHTPLHYPSSNQHPLRHEANLRKR